MIKPKNKAGFSKEQFLNSDRFANKRDLLQTVLKDDEKYTAEQADKLISAFLKREAK